MRIALAILLLTIAAPVRADDPPKAPVVDFKITPKWVPVAGTDDKVLMIQADQRPKYDIFQSGGKYYIYRKDSWFRSDTLNGTYALVDIAAVPTEIHVVPKESWVVYPTNWGSMGTSSGPGSVYGGSNGPGMTASTSTVAGGSTSATTGTIVGTTSDNDAWAPTVTFSTAPKWITVPGSAKVYYVEKTARPSYDLYRYNTRYYTYQRDNWFSSSSLNGPYTLVATTDVPIAFRTVRKDYWVSYPSGWTYITPAAAAKAKIE